MAIRICSLAPSPNASNQATEMNCGALLAQHGDTVRTASVTRSNQCCTEPVCCRSTQTARMESQRQPVELSLASPATNSGLYGTARVPDVNCRDVELSCVPSHRQRMWLERDYPIA